MLSVLQPWVMELPLMQQSVLITSCRGPDTLHKNHIAKVLCRWLRRCYLLFAFKGTVINDPYNPDGGSFTGPCVGMTIDEAVDAYLKCIDEIPHHFHLHLVHAAEILGYKHPNPNTREWWHDCYLRFVRDMHLMPESKQKMDRRLGDDEVTWREAEEVIADNSGITEVEKLEKRNA